MNMAQIVVLVVLALQLIGNLYMDFNGRPARPAGNFIGVIATLFMFVMLLFTLWAAGALSTIF